MFLPRSTWRSRSLTGRLAASHCRASAVLAISVAAIANASLASAMELQPKPFALVVSGIEVRVTVKATVDARTEGEGLIVAVRAEADLIDVQRKATAIAQAVPKPSDNCARNGLNPVVNDVTGATLKPSGSQAILSLSGHVTVWACKKIAGQKVKTKVPPSNLAITVSAPLTLSVLDSSRVGLALAGPVSVSGEGLAGDIASLLAGVYQGVIAEQLSKALDASAARASLPPVEGLSVTIKSASFASRADNLLMQAEGTGTMSGAGFGTLVSRWSER